MKNILGTGLLKGGSVLLGLVSTPAYIRFFADQAILGAWFAVVSILNWMFLFDLGVGNGLRNTIVPALAKRDFSDARKLISSGYLFSACVASLIGSLGWYLIGIVDWETLLGISTPALPESDLVGALRIVLISVAVQIGLGSAKPILYAMQRLVLANSLSLLSSGLVLVFLLVGRTGDVRLDLRNVALASFVATVAPLVVVNVYIFAVVLSESRPSLRFVSRHATRRVVHLGLGFFSVQISLLVMNSTDQLLIANLFGSEFVVEQQVYLRVFGLGGMMFQLLAHPIWSAVTAAHVDNQFSWIRRAYMYLGLAAALGSLLVFLLIPGLQFVFDVWLGYGAFHADPGIGVIFATLATLEMAVYASTAIANGIGRLSTQILCTALGAFIKFPLAYLLSSVCDVWSAVVLSHAISLLPLAIVQPVVLRRELRST